MGDDQEPLWDKIGDGINDFAQGEGNAHGIYDLGTAMASKEGASAMDLLAPFGLNYDAPADPVADALSKTVASPEEQAANQKAMDDMIAGAHEGPAPAAPVGESAMPEAPPAAEVTPPGEVPNPLGGEAAGIDGLGAAEGALGIVAGGFQAAHGISTIAKGGEANTIDGSLDVLGGGASMVAGGLGGAVALGMGGAGLAAASAVAAPVAAAIGFGVAGDHAAEGMHLWGKDAEGNYQGSVEAAWNASKDAGSAVDNALGGGVLGAVGGGLAMEGSAAVLETGAVAADIGLGIDSMGAGYFGSAKNADGKGTHSMGAFEALNHYAGEAGDGVDNALGLDKNSLGGEVVGGAVQGLIDVEGAGLALGADALGGVASAGKAVGGALDSLGVGAFGTLDKVGAGAGAGADAALGLDQNSLAGEVVGGAVHGLVDVAGSGLALAADVGGAVGKGVDAVGGAIADGVGAVGSFLGDIF